MESVLSLLSAKRTEADLITRKLAAGRVHCFKDESEYRRKQVNSPRFERGDITIGIPCDAD